jgi:hypothetical protein
LTGNGCPTAVVSNPVSFPRLLLWSALALALSAIAHAQSPWAVRHQRAGGEDLWGIASGPGGLVAVGTNGTLLQSTDGQTWTTRTSGTTDWLTAVTYGNGRYVAVGDHGRIISSTDGATWTAITQTATTQRLNNVAFADNNRTPFPHTSEFVAIGENGTIIYSFDGDTWIAATSGTTSWLRGLAFGLTTEGGVNASESCWLAAGQAGTLLMSSDGANWVSTTSGVNSDIEAVAFLGSTHNHPVAGPGAGSLIFAIAGADGLATTLSFSAVDSVGPAPPNFPIYGVSAPTVANPRSIATTRIRALAMGPASLGHFLTSGGSGALLLAPPAVALDESGHVFSLIPGDDWSLSAKLQATGGWQTDAATLGAAMRAGTFSVALDSFFFVGERETIYQRDQVFNGRAGNLSTRGFVDQGDKALIAGLVVKGATPKSILIRGAGPALTGFGITNALARPVLTIYNASGQAIATNSGWGTAADPAAIAAAAARTGAFAFAAGSNDTALLLTLAPGNYTAQVAGAGGSSGVALVEAYDLDPRVSGTSRAINLSTRGQVAAGENALIAGLNVQGPIWRRFLVRAVGPSLAQFNVANVLADPVVTLDSSLVYPATLDISTTRDPVSIAAATSGAGAFPLNAGATNDVMIATLPPANYTFKVTSRSGATGVALIEVYELPSSSQ